MLNVNAKLNYSALSATCTAKSKDVSQNSLNNQTQLSFGGLSSQLKAGVAALALSMPVHAADIGKANPLNHTELTAGIMQNLKKTDAFQALTGSKISLGNDTKGYLITGLCKKPAKAENPQRMVQVFFKTDCLPPITNFIARPLTEIETGTLAKHNYIGGGNIGQISPKGVIKESGFISLTQEFIQKMASKMQEGCK